MKRMMLVPEDAYARFEQKQKLETSPIVKAGYRRASFL